MQLRLGVLLEDLRPPAWIARVIRDLRAAPEASLVVVGQLGASAPAQREPVAARALRRLHAAVDARLFAVAADPFERADLPELSGVDVLALDPRAEGDADVLADDDLARLAGHRLDVLVSFLPRALGGGIFGCARYGVWTYQFGDEAPPRGGPDGFWEVVDGAAVTRSALRAQTDPRHARILYESWSATDPVSVRRSRASGRWKASAFVRRCLRELAEDGPAVLEARPRIALPEARPPAASGRELAAGLARLGGAALRREARRLVTRDQWTLAYRTDPATRGGVPARSLAGAERLAPPLDRFWADPFAAPHGDGWAVLFEEKLYAERKAHISVLQIDRDGRAGEPERVLERDYHLSYPFLFSWEGAWWMVPETAQHRTVELWRATEFPRRWKLERTLFEGVQAVDSTLFEHEGAWWMYANLGEPGASREEELHLFHAPSPLGPWTPHRRNPVRSDIRCARPAGRPFWTDGAWHRPAQDGSGGYGSALVLHRIERLDPHGFEERQVARIAPDWAPGLTGLHTLNACDGLTVLDVRVTRPRYTVSLSR
ncbi:MAG TPA: hypothetical protein VK932_04855 [Kofleriaceae bacterium]|nr:hypothetical protein [Kofleriaceae bacterium]